MWYLVEVISEFVPLQLSKVVILGKTYMSSTLYLLLNFFCTY